MGKGVVLSLVFVFAMLILVQNAVAVSTDLQSPYQSSQTILTKIYGNILAPIEPTQIEFKKANVRVPFDYDIKKLGDNYYLWFNTPNVENQTNYTLIIHNITTTISGNNQIIDYYQNFTVNPEISNYYIKPGLIYTKNDFQVQIMLNGDNDLNINVDFPTSTTYTLKPGSNTLTFHVKDASQTGLTFIQIGKYQFAAYMIVNQSFAPKKNYIIVSPGYITSTRLFTDNNIYYQIQISNLGINPINNLYLQVNTDEFSVNPSDNITLAPNKSQMYQITLNNPSRRNINDSFYIVSSDNNISLNLPIQVLFVENLTNQTTVGNVSANQTSLYNCADLLGQICSSDQVCSGNSVVSSEGLCCEGICTASNNSSGSGGSWWGYIIAVVVIAGLVVLYLRYKKVKPDQNPVDKKLSEIDKDLGKDPNKNMKRVP